uniref:Uncharacterized protein n=1 Tax=Anguilla anguilla TaxID=7936 RepID=A0A0E9SAV1_ANGAN
MSKWRDGRHGDFLEMTVAVRERSCDLFLKVISC